MDPLARTGRWANSLFVCGDANRSCSQAPLDRQRCHVSANVRRGGVASASVSLPHREKLLMESLVYGHTLFREISTQRGTETCGTAEPEAGVAPLRYVLPDPITGQAAIARRNQNMQMDIGIPRIIDQVLQRSVVNIRSGVEQVDGLCCRRPVYCKMLHSGDEWSDADAAANPDLHRPVVIERETAIRTFDRHLLTKL